MNRSLRGEGASKQHAGGADIGGLAQSKSQSTLGWRRVQLCDSRVWRPTNTGNISVTASHPWPVLVS